MIIKLNALNYMFDVEFVEGSDVNWSCILGRRLEVSLSATQLSKFLFYTVSVFNMHWINILQVNWTDEVIQTLKLTAQRHGRLTFNDVTSVTDQTADGRYVCKLCCALFKDRGAFVEHVTGKHVGLKPELVCKNCGKTFGHRASLWRHAKICK